MVIDVQQKKELGKRNRTRAHQSIEKSSPEESANMVIPSMPKVNSMSSSDLELRLLLMLRADETEGDDSGLETDNLPGVSRELDDLLRLGVDVLKLALRVKGSSRPILSFWL